MISPEEQPFLDEIRANPHDDAARLVYADWLEERGDVRAEYLRLECEPCPSPHYRGRGYHVALRMRKLMGSIDRQWLDAVTRESIEDCERDDCPYLLPLQLKSQGSATCPFCHQHLVIDEEAKSARVVMPRREDRFEFPDYV